ncbi:MAG: translocation/assembly module TamB domain-containing protein [Pleurocapsa sp. MO_226.B13]|nr:translocation/assembly module TamB domain-containing protein [Pleurocapsa sp. MO_226.B13]
MTRINEPPNPNPKKQNSLQQLLEKLKPSPKQAATGIIAIAALGSLGYWGLNILVKKKLPPFLETQIGNFIERPIYLGEVKGFSLNSIEFSETVIPPTNTDRDRIEVKAIEVGFNIFPVLFRRTLPLEVRLIQPNVYLKQEQDGEWLNLDFLASDPNREKKDPLLYFDVDLEVEQADITAVPYEQQPLQAQLDGSGRFNQKTGFIDYDLDADIEQAQASIQGETELETGTTNTKLLVDDLALSDLSTLLPIPVEIETGRLNADLDINIPSFEEITAANVKGTLNLQNLTGEAKDLNAPVSAESKLNFGGRNADIQEAQASLGNITAQVDGEVNLDSGYDLDANILPFQLGSLPPGLREQLPVEVAGEVEAQVRVQGAIKEPKLTGSINNTQTVTIAKTQFERINTDFRADLAKVVLENVQIKPVAGGSVTAEGTIETNLKQTLESDRSIEATKMPLAFSFQANLPTQELVSPYYQLPETVAIGNLEAQGQIDGTVDNPKALVKWNIGQVDAPNLEDIAGSGEAVFADNNLALRDTQITYGDGKVDLTADTNLDSQQWQASLEADSLNLTPFLTEFDNSNLDLNRPVALDTAEVDLNGSLDNLTPEGVRGTAELNLDVDGGNVAVDSQLNNGNLQAKVVTSDIQIDNFVTSLPVATELQSGTINASTSLKQLLAIGKTGNLNSLQADADLDLLVDGEAVAVNSQIDSGTVGANANTSQIDLNRVAPNLPIPANIRSSQVTASAQLQQLLNFGQNPNLSTVDADLDADLDVASGTVKAIASLDNNQWRANLNASNISSQVLLDKFAPENFASVEVDNIDAQVDLSGDINPVIKNQLNIPINVDRVAVNSGVQSVNAEGNLTLSSITNNLDVANTNLDVAANLDFDRLPIDGILTATTQNNQLIAESVNIQGEAIFDGQFTGKQLLSAPNTPGNINLTGDLRLEDFAFNDIDFDLVMTGEVEVQPGEQIALNLQGEEDVIAARAVPCNADNCKLPYLPTNLELRQGEDTENPVIATGNRNGDLFSLDINNFPLALLNLAPATSAGIEGALVGKTTGNVDLNLYTLAAQGDIQINNPGVGYIKADRLAANFNYDPAENLAEITSASLDLKESEYNLNAALDLQSGEIDGKLNIPEAYIQDVLTTFRWFTIEDITNLFDLPDYGSPAAVKPAPEKDLVDKSIARKLNQLRVVNRQIQANAAAKESGSIPSELDIRGRYAGEITIGGTIQTPQADFRVEGNRWQWQPTEAYPDIVPPLGLVIEEPQYINIPKLQIEGELQGTEVDLETARLEVQEAVLSLRGKLSPEKFDTKYTVANLTIDNISNFVKIPVDLAGEINTVGTLQGTIDKPQLSGKIAFSDGAFNGNVLPAEIAGKYDYDGSRLAFNTTAPDSIQIEASVPYPIIPGKSDRVYAKANLDSEAFIFLDALSQKYLNWNGGEGNAQLEASARLDLQREGGIIYDLDANGVVNLENANIHLETPFFSEPFIGTGKIVIDNQIVNVETLDATFAEKDLSIAGQLPILTAVNNLENPLTINIPKEGEINIDRLYRGGVDGKVTVTGASLQPVIGGEVNLEDGNISIPKTEQPEPDAAPIARNNRANRTSTQNNTGDRATNSNQAAGSTAFVTTLDDLQINLKDFKLEQLALYEFELEGGLTLNGTVDNPRNIRPEGTLMLTKADVNLYSNSFELARGLENTIVFTPEAGVFNPTMNVVLRTNVVLSDDNSGDRQEELNALRTADSNVNEINDPITNIDNSNTIRISLVVDGQAEEILPNLAQNNTDCNIRPNDAPLVENSQYYSQAELNRLTECFNGIALTATNNENDNTIAQRNLTNSSAVRLTSTPALDQGEIIRLLSERFVAFARNTISGGGDEGLSQERIYQIGVERFIISPLILPIIEDTTIGWGKAVGLDYFTVYPDLQGVYEISERSSLRLTYDYNLLGDASEAIAPSLNLFGSDSAENTTGNEVRLEYEINF